MTDTEEAKIFHLTASPTDLQLNRTRDMAEVGTTHDAGNSIDR